MAVDWDTILAYNTIKIVTIRDKRLGMLHILFILSIVFYIIVYSTIIKKGYISSEDVVGSVRTSLLGPETFPKDLPYCSSNTNTPYTSYNFPKLNCLYWDDPLVQFPIGDDVGFTATTRVKTFEQKATCSLYDPSCKFETVSIRNDYTADIENFTITIDHTFFTTSSNTKYNANQLSGYIIDENGNEIQINDGINTIGIEGKQDVIQMGKLLEFSGIFLDDPSPVNSSNSIRYDGVVAFVFITYSNLFSYNQHNFKYVYSVKKADDTIFQVPEVFISDNFNSRLYLRRNGIRLIFIQNGSIGKFSFQTLLLTLVSGLGLLTLSTLVVDQLAIRLLPQRKSYSSVKYQITENMNMERKKSKKLKKLVIDDKGEKLLYDKIESL